MKHYTPTIEELKIGFNCEVIESNDPFSRYHPHVIDKIKLARILLYNEDEITKNIRVKHLDIDDIKSIGFKDVTEDGSEIRTLILDNEKLCIHLTYCKFSNWSSISIKCSVYHDSVKTDVVHSIRIMNINELKTLLKQLNLINGL